MAEGMKACSYIWECLREGGKHLKTRKFIFDLVFKIPVFFKEVIFYLFIYF